MNRRGFFARCLEVVAGAMLAPALLGERYVFAVPRPDNDKIGDLIQATLKDMGTLKWENIAGQLQANVALSNLLKKNRERREFGNRRLAMSKVKYIKNGKEVSEEEFREGSVGIDFDAPVKTLHGRSVVAGVGGKAGWPVYSDALGVLPEQRQEAYEESVRNGCPTQFDSKGCAILTDAKHAKKLRRSVGMFDRQGFES